MCVDKKTDPNYNNLESSSCFLYYRLLIGYWIMDSKDIFNFDIQNNASFVFPEFEAIISY